MIGSLKGIIDSINTDHILLDVQGVGYMVHCSANTLRSLPGVGEVAHCHIETHVREDHIHLYGFASQTEKQAFTTLTKISGVGTKMALAILSGMTPDQLSTAIAAEDKAAFTAISGVGPKLANRLLTELKDKFTFTSNVETLPTQNTQPNATLQQDAILALTQLGFNRSDAYSAVQKIIQDNDQAPIDDIIRQGLKALSNG